MPPTCRDVLYGDEQGWLHSPLQFYTKRAQATILCMLAFCNEGSRVYACGATSHKSDLRFCRAMFFRLLESYSLSLNLDLWKGPWRIFEEIRISMGEFQNAKWRLLRGVDAGCWLADGLSVWRRRGWGGAIGWVFLFAPLRKKEKKHLKPPANFPLALFSFTQVLSYLG